MSNSFKDKKRRYSDNMWDDEEKPNNKKKQIRHPDSDLFRDGRKKHSKKDFFELANSSEEDEYDEYDEFDDDYRR